MSGPPETLRDLQAWMQAAITHPRGILATTDASTVREIVKPSAAWDSLARLAIYHHAYFARLVEVMRELFPALVTALDQQTFDALALAYLEQNPPRSYTLNQLADRFIPFLQATRPARTSGDTADWADFAIDLARLEMAIDEVFDGPGIEDDPPLDARRMESLTTGDADQLRLQLAPCVRLLELQFPLNDYYTAFRRGEAPPPPPPGRSWLALHRRDYIVRRLPLAAGEYAVLAALSPGAPLGEAVAAALAYIPAADLPAQLQAWFRDWAAAGIVGWPSRRASLNESTQ